MRRQPDKGGATLITMIMALAEVARGTIRDASERETTSNADGVSRPALPHAAVSEPESESA